MALDLSKNSKTERFNARLNPLMKKTLKKAAALEGFSSLADFIVTTAYREATRVIKDHEVISLTQQDQELFVQALFTPLELSRSLKESAEAYKSIYLR